ncbi:MAG: ATP-binding cassette domain-containing protein, partial [Defluviitaleaceae bacterium]|nr:ATP-binding cassette domain-containing protein [Defluviitaleaceae bacterium]
MILSLKDIDLSFGITQILKNVSFTLGAKEKVGLVGVNGAGKTSLFKIITGENTPDKGQMTLKQGTTVGYLSQNVDLDEGRTIFEELASVFNHLETMQKDIRQLEASMANVEGQELEKTMARYSRMVQEFEEAGGYGYQSRVRGVLAGLGFESEQKISQLSGGQKTRVSLGKLLLKQPDLLLLDEPTNHLDIATINWLEDYLVKEYEKCVFIISHDRYFLDKVVGKVIEVENQAATLYHGNYSYFIEEKAKNFEAALARYENQQKEIKKQQDSIDLLKSFNREKSIKRAESKEKMLAKVERLQAPQKAPDDMRMTLKTRTKSGNDVLKIREGKKTFGDFTLFEGVDMDIQKGEVVALIGENGIGKTTLFSLILDGADEVALGTNVKIGYYDQKLAFDNMEKSIFEEISDAHPSLKNQEIRSTLAAFLFTGDDVFKPLSALSGGEKGRVALAKLMLSDINFLLLDEPTNHLDFFSKRVLEQAIKAYEGTVLYISHDRYFINHTA